MFGLYGHGNVNLRRVATLPRRHCRVYFNQIDPSGRRNVGLIALENGCVTANQDNLPSLPASISRCPYTQSNEIWVHSSCSMRNLTLIYTCINNSVPHGPVVGMPLHYADGHRGSVGQFRLDWRIEPLAVGETDKLYICGKRTKQSWGYVATVTTQAPLIRTEGNWLDIVQVDSLEWWFSSRHSVLFYNDIRLN